MPDEVAAELHAGSNAYPSLLQALGLNWVSTVTLATMPEITAYALYKGEFGGGPDRNNGEAAVLAWARVNQGTAIIDERVATRAAKRDGIPVHGTLWLVVNAFRAGDLTRADAEAMTDELVSTDMKLPVDGAGLFAWAYEEGLLP